jgi:adenosine deaminase
MIDRLERYLFEQSAVNRPFDFYKNLPKVELHRHLEGSLRLSTMQELIKKRETSALELDVEQLPSLVQMQLEDPQNFQIFLSKFQTLRLFYRSPQIIARITREAIADAAEDNVKYLELHFTPVALARAKGFALGEVMDWVAESARQAEKDFGVMTRLIASVNRHESLALAEQVASLAVDRKAAGIVGLGLAGNEAEFSALPFAPLFREVREAGLHTTIHAGEWGGAENVREAVEDLHADRIGHGVRVLEDPEVVKLVCEREIALEMCITSNYHTGVISSLETHPFYDILKAGVNATLNTDDPSISRITLSDEYRLACEKLGVPIDVLYERIFSAAKAAFLPLAESQMLIDILHQAIDQI